MDMLDRRERKEMHIPGVACACSQLLTNTPEIESPYCTKLHGLTTYYSCYSIRTIAVCSGSSTRPSPGIAERGKKRERKNPIVSRVL